VVAEQVVAILTATTALLGALGAIFAQLIALRHQMASNHDAINGRVGELLTATQLAALKEGELRGRDSVVPVERLPAIAATDPFLAHRGPSDPQTGT
jgi:hypothetical protein